jgi:hypothetical protein
MYSMYCHVLGDYRRVLDCQLDLLDYSVHTLQQTQGWQRLLSLCSTATNSAGYLANTNSSGLQTRLSLAH